MRLIKFLLKTMFEKCCSYCEAEQEQEQNSPIVATSACIVNSKVVATSAGVVVYCCMHEGEAREEDGEDCFQETYEDEDDCAFAVLHHDVHIDYRMVEDLLLLLAENLI